MAKIVALFGGQGSQYPGMGKALYDHFPEVRDIYQCAGDIFGYDVAKMSFTGTAEDLMDTKVAQTTLFTLAVSAYTAARERLGAVSAVAGHSLGEYAALCCAGACTLEDGMRLLLARARAMERATGTRKGVMYAIVGPDAAAVEAACAQIGGAVWPVNYNLPTQTVIAGEPERCAAAAELLQAQGAKAVPLEVAGAFHTPMMDEAAAELREATGACTFLPMKPDFYSNLTGGRLVIEDYPDYLVRHMLSPVRFVDEVAAMAADGLDTCIEFGPKRAVTLVKKNNKAFGAYHVEDVQTLEKTVQTVTA